MVVGTENAQESTGSVINLSKGAKINLTKDAPGLKKIMFSSQNPEKIKFPPFHRKGVLLYIKSFAVSPTP